MEKWNGKVWKSGKSLQKNKKNKEPKKQVERCLRYVATK